MGSVCFEILQADITKEDRLGRQCLHLAAEAGCAASVVYLSRSRGFDVSIQTLTSGVTPLHLATKVILVIDLNIRTVCVCVCVCVRACVRACVRVCVNTHPHSAHTLTNTPTLTRAHEYTHMHKYTCSDMHTLTCTHGLTITYMQFHAHTCIQ